MLLPALLSGLFSVVAGCAAPDQESSALDEAALRADEAGPNDVIACKGIAGSEKGNVRISLRPQKVSEEESTLHKRKVVAIALSGSYGQETIGYSQGDQPVIASFSKTGTKVKLGLLDKSYMTLEEGGGEDESTVFVGLSTLTVDTKEGSLTVEGIRRGLMMDPNGGFKTTLNPVTFNFKSCGTNQKALGAIEKIVKAK